MTPAEWLKMRPSSPWQATASTRREIWRKVARIHWPIYDSYQVEYSAVTAPRGTLLLEWFVNDAPQIKYPLHVELMGSAEVPCMYSVFFDLKAGDLIRMRFLFPSLWSRRTVSVMLGGRKWL